MKATIGLAVLGMLFLAACGSDPTSPSGPGIDFDLSAPTELPTKSKIDVVITITRARGVVFPLEVEIEKKNVGQPFNRQGLFFLADEDDRRIAMPVVLRMDPLVRVTVTDSGTPALSVTKTVAVDVLDFP
jgi:hypothetical protein